MLSSLEKRVALVTGAGRGIGKAIAIGLADEGADLVLLARTAKEIEEVAAEIRSKKRKAVPVVADVTNEQEVERAIAHAHGELGTIDILVNNAGINNMASFLELKTEDWWKVVEVNLKGTYLCSKFCLPKMIEKGWGRIINISSAGGKIGYPFATPYCSAKHGVIGFTKALASEVATKGVTVNAICPGWVATAMNETALQQRATLFNKTVAEIRAQFLSRIPMQKQMQPEDMIGAVLFFASEHSAFTTGESMNVSGGSIMH